MKRAELHKMQYDLLKESIITDTWLHIKDRDGSTLDIMKEKSIPAIVVGEIDHPLTEVIDEVVVKNDKIFALTSTAYGDTDKYDLEDFEVPFLIAILDSVEKHIELEDSK